MSKPVSRTPDRYAGFSQWRETIRPSLAKELRKNPGRPYVNAAGKHLAHFRYKILDNVEAVYISTNLYETLADGSEEARGAISKKSLANMVSKVIRRALAKIVGGEWTIDNTKYLPNPFNSDLKGAYVIASAKDKAPDEAQTSDYLPSPTATPVAHSPDNAAPSALTTPYRAEEPHAVVKSRILRVGYSGWPGMLERDENQASVGLYAHLVRSIVEQAAAETGDPWKVQFEIRNVHEWRSEMAKPYNDRAVDLVAAMVETPRRKAFGDFIGRSHLVHLTGVFRSVDRRVRQLSDFTKHLSATSRYTFGVVKGEAGEEFLTEVLDIPKEKIGKYVYTKDSEKLLPRLLSPHSPEYDVIVTNAVVINGQLNRYHSARRSIDVRFRTLAVHPVGFMIQKGDETLARWLEPKIQRARESHEFLSAQRDFLRNMRSNGLEGLLQPFHVENENKIGTIAPPAGSRNAGSRRNPGALQAVHPPAHRKK